MKSVTALSLLATVSSALAQNSTFLAGLFQTLEQSGATSFATAASQANGTTIGQQLFGNLSNGDTYLLFVPNDAAFANAPANATESITDTIAYHIVRGNFSGDVATYPNTTLGRTFLNDPTYVNLEGGESQVVAWARRSDGSVHILNQANDSVVVNTTSYGNVSINIIDSVLEFPGSLADAVVADQNASLSELQTVLGQIQFPYYNSTSNSTANISTFDVLNTGAHGFTLFAPNGSALATVSSQLQSASTNQTLSDIILQNHIINGTSLYSSELVGQSYTSAAGETFSFILNSTGHYVTNGNVTALITQPDVLLENGVLHVIDDVFLNFQSDPSAASSAASSATSAAAHDATATSAQTGPIGFSQTAGLATGSSAGASATSSHSGAMGLYQTSSAQMWAVAAALVGAVVGGVMTLV